MFATPIKLLMGKLTMAVLFAGAAFDISADYEIQLLSSDYDFGVMKEVAGPSTGEVKIVNLGPDPTYIRQVRPSCGCTGADYFQGEIAPGDTAWVSFTYNPAGRPGRFEKTVKVLTGDDSRKHVIRIHGTVLGAPETLDRSYPVEAGPLRLTEKTADLGKVVKGRSRHFFINLYNQTPDSLPVSLKSSDKALDLDITPKVIGPGDIATMSIYLNSRSVEQEGPNEFSAEIYAGDAKSPTATVDIRANIIPDSSEMTVADVAQAARISVPKSVVTIGDVAPGKRHEFSFLVESAGNANLRLMRISSPSLEISIKNPPKSVKAGTRAMVKGLVSLPVNASGAFRYPIEIVSDDPLHPLTTVYITGNAK